MAGLISKELVATSIVSPSAGALASAAVATMVPAPGRFSITTDWPPQRTDRRSARMRATTSVGPPAANGTRSLTGRDGFHDRHLRFAVRRTLPAALGWAKARKLHRDVQPVLPAVSALLAAGEPRKKCPGNAPGRGPTTETEITADKGFDRSRTARGAAATC